MFGKRRSSEQSVAISRELRAELDDADRKWMYEWDFGGNVRAATFPDPELQHLHQTRLELMEAPVRDALATARGDARAIDLACNEGWFAHQLLGWGARSAIGIDVRPETIRRAEAVRKHFQISSRTLDFRVDDIFKLQTEKLGSFDVVLLLGLLYHLENPVGAMKVARRLTKSVCIIETKIARANEPIEHAVGASGATTFSQGCFATTVEADSATNPLASAPGILSLTPNRAAMDEMLAVAGFGRHEYLSPEPSHNKLYVDGDRVVVAAWAER